MNTLRIPLFATVALACTLFVACGEGSAQGNSSPTPAAGDDTAAVTYVSAVCEASARMFTAYQKAFQANLPSLGGMDPTDAYARTAREPFAALIAELEKLAPPPGAAEAHAETLKQARDVLDAMNRMDRQKLLALRGTPDTGTWKQVIDLAAPLKAQFGATAQRVDACRQLKSSGAGNPFEQ